MKDGTVYTGCFVACIVVSGVAVLDIGTRLQDRYIREQAERSSIRIERGMSRKEAVKECKTYKAVQDGNINMQTCIHELTIDKEVSDEGF